MAYFLRATSRQYFFDFGILECQPRYKSIKIVSKIYPGVLWPKRIIKI